MGLQASIPALDPVKDYDSRLVFVQFEEMNRLSEAVFYKYSIRYQRYKWSIAKRFSDFKTLDVQLRNCFPQQMAPIPVPVKKSKIFWSHSDAFLKVRGENLSKYMALVLDRFGALVFSSIHLKQFIEVGPNSFRAEVWESAHPFEWLYLMRCVALCCRWGARAKRAFCRSPREAT